MPDEVTHDKTPEVVHGEKPMAPAPHDEKLPAIPPLAAHVVSGIDPTSGPAGSPITISGSGFGAQQGTSHVTVDGVSIDPFTWSDTSIQVSIPSRPTGPAKNKLPVVVTVGGHKSEAVLFRVT